MKLAIMQPYFFPYLGYFDLINCSDTWIIFDTVQYIRHGWINRNRILHPSGGWSYIIVPVNASRSTPIREVRIADGDGWKKRILGQLQTYQRAAPFYAEVKNLLEDCLSCEDHSISRLNTFILGRVCAYIGVPFNFAYFSEMDLNLKPIEGPGDWALRIAQALGAQEYVNPPGGEHLFSKAQFEESGIKLTVRRLPALEYDCQRYEFIPNLSILDVLMWNSPTEVKKYLDDHRS